ncbi:MAG: hypothetical protein HYY50_03255 [Candidatus Kerfeldbacteria bacterium]|nr:hypothetical protein [Candidatus Kerfeldbacteria bacterium]
MNLWTITLFILAASLLSLSGWMVQRYQRSPSITYYAGFLSALSAIAIIQGSLFLNLESPVVLFLTRLGYLAGAATFSFLLLFTWYFPIPSQRIPKNDRWYLLLPIVFFLPLVLFNPSFIRNVVLADGFWHEIHGPLFWVFPIFVSVYVVWSLANLVTKFRYVQSPQWGSIKVFMVALIAAVLSGLIFDVLIPVTGRPRIPIGIYSASLLFGFSTYIVAKK